MTIKELVARFRKPALPLHAVLAFVVAGCNQVGGATMTFWDVIWAMVFFYFWFMCIWIWISVIGDIFRRNDLSGPSKFIWIMVAFIIPLFGALIYMITRPKVTAQDVQLMTQADAAAKAAAGVSTADQIEKLNQLLASGAITQPSTRPSRPRPSRASVSQPRCTGWRARRPQGRRAAAFSFARRHRVSHPGRAGSRPAGGGDRAFGPRIGPRLTDRRLIPIIPLGISPRPTSPRSRRSHIDGQKRGRRP